MALSGPSAAIPPGVFVRVGRGRHVARLTNRVLNSYDLAEVGGWEEMLSSWRNERLLAYSEKYAEVVKTNSASLSRMV
jgi:hypothetical protein